MASNRLGRINEEIMKDLSSLIRDLKDPRKQGMISILRVDTTPDLRYSKIYISVMGTPEQKKSTGKALRSASGYLRRELGRTLQLRYTPELEFELDDSIAQGSHILSLLNQIEQKEVSSDDTDQEE